MLQFGGQIRSAVRQRSSRGARVVPRLPTRKQIKTRRAGTHVTSVRFVALCGGLRATQLSIAHRGSGDVGLASSPQHRRQDSSSVRLRRRLDDDHDDRALEQRCALQDGQLAGLRDALHQRRFSIDRQSPLGRQQTVM